MADTLTINVRDIRYSDTVHVRIPIINKTNPCFGYDATEDQIRQLMSIPNYEIRDAATGVIINGHNLQEYFPGGGGGGGGVTPAEVKTMIANSIDATVSATSKNAIQNKVIKQYVDDNVDGKVDKVQGKGLSTNDYTTTEKTKLEELADIQSIGDGLSLDNGELSATGGSGGTSDYNDLENQPSINNITLVGNKSLSDLGIAAESDIPTSGADIGLGNVDNTSDLDKPISTATQAALDGKQPTLTTEQLAAMNSGITSADVEQINTNAAILSQTYNSADCNMSIYLCQDNGVGNQSTYYMTDQSKMNFAIRYFGRLVRYWKDGVDYQKFRWSSVGVIATNNSTKKDMLTLDIPEVTNETYVKIFYPTDDVPMDDPDGGYNWRKSSVNVGDVWYIRPHIEYTDLETGMEYTMYGAVYKVTAGVPCTIECDTLSCTELTAREQVNENNISLLEQMNGAKNLCNWKNATEHTRQGLSSVTKTNTSLSITSSGAWAHIAYAIGTLSAGEYIAIAKISDYTVASSTCRFGVGASIDKTTDIIGNGVVTHSFTLNADTSIKLYFYANWNGTAYINSYTASDIMIITKAAYDAGFTDYQPYALSNAELTNNIVSINARYSDNANVQTDIDNLNKSGIYAVNNTTTFTEAVPYQYGTLFHMEMVWWRMQVMFFASTSYNKPIFRMSNTNTGGGAASVWNKWRYFDGTLVNP